MVKPLLFGLTCLSKSKYHICLIMPRPRIGLRKHVCISKNQKTSTLSIICKSLISSVPVKAMVWILPSFLVLCFEWF